MHSWFRIEYIKHKFEIRILFIISILISILTSVFLIKQEWHYVDTFKDNVQTSLQMISVEKANIPLSNPYYALWELQEQRLNMLDMYIKNNDENAIITQLHEVDMHWKELKIRDNEVMTLGNYQDRLQQYDISKELNWPIQFNPYKVTAMNSLWLICNHFSIPLLFWGILIIFLSSSYRSSENELYLCIKPSNRFNRFISRLLFYLSCSLLILLVGLSVVGITGLLLNGMGYEHIVSGNMTIYDALFQKTIIVLAYSMTISFITIFVSSILHSDKIDTTLLSIFILATLFLLNLDIGYIWGILCIVSLLLVLLEYFIKTGFRIPV